MVTYTTDSDVNTDSQGTPAKWESDFDIPALAPGSSAEDWDTREQQERGQQN